VELRHLRYFIAAAEEEHFGRASQRLHVTRPAVSQIISTLEDELGMPLFERFAHRVKLTAAGRVLLPRLQTVMHDLNKALVVVRRVGDGKSGALTIGYGSLTLLHPLFRAAVKKFHQSCPDVTMTLVEIPTSEQTKALAEGRIDAGFMHFGPKSLDARKSDPANPLAPQSALERLKIQSGGLGVVVPRDHPLSRRKSVSLAELAGERFVVVPRSSVSPGYGPLFLFCQKAGFEPRIVQEVGSIATLLNLVSVGVGIGLAVTGKKFTYPSNLAIVRVDDVNYPTTFSLGWAKGPTEPVLARFVQVVKALA
jgi:DNA-binding transcriptional LysR family regulator